jgi:hypothetical protein
VVAAVVLVCLVLSAGFTSWSSGWGAALLAGLSVLWLVVNNPMEGVVLVQLSAGHGITGADLTGLAGLALATSRGASALRRGRRNLP